MNKLYGQKLLYNPDLGCHFISYEQLQPSASRTFLPRRGNPIYNFWDYNFLKNRWGCCVAVFFAPEIFDLSNKKGQIYKADIIICG